MDFNTAVHEHYLYDQYLVTRCYSWAMYIEFGMSESKLHCTNVGDELMKNIWGQLQLDLIQVDDYFDDSCVINPAAFCFLSVFTDKHSYGRQKRL